MNKFKLAAAAMTGSLVAAGTAQAGPTTFNSTGSIQTFTVTQTGDYEIVADGAQGGTGGQLTSPGGDGASLGGEILLNAGTTLEIVVGGQGVGGLGASQGAGGGGGGSFVYTDVSGTLKLLIAAGGGGGGGAASRLPGGAAQTGNNGTAGVSGGAGGTNGAGGKSKSTSPFGGGGAGWLSNGASGEAPGGGGGIGPTAFTGGSAFLGGGAGEFGGGGGGSGFGGGGGGGYSGGGGGFDGGGGGGSFLDVDFFDPATAKANHTGDGEVIITEIEAIATVPEPSSTASFVAGLLGLGSLAYRRRKTNRSS